MTELQKIKSLIQRYGSARAQEELAGSRDAPIDVLKRHNAAGKAAYDELIKRIEDLTHALGESIKLQSHYSKMLNMYDGGERLVFASTDEWIARIAECA